MKNPLIFLFCLFLFGCEPENPCETVDCDKGFCEDGLCICDEGFTGSACDKEVLPQKLFITSMEVDAYPVMRADGTYWDTEQEGIYPDVRAAIRKDGVLLWSSSIWWSDVNGLELEFGITPDIEIDDVESNIEVVLFDVDANGQEEMISTSFQCYSQNGDGLYAPSIGFSSDEFDFRLFIDYEF